MSPTGFSGKKRHQAPDIKSALESHAQAERAGNYRALFEMEGTNIVLFHVSYRQRFLANQALEQGMICAAEISTRLKFSLIK